jgi:hypothetical protein
MQRLIAVAASLAVLSNVQTAFAFSVCTYQERGCLDRVDASKSPTPAARNQCIDQYKTCVANNTPAAQARFKAERDALNAAAHNNVTSPGGPANLYPAQGGPAPKKSAAPATPKAGPRYAP